MHVGNLFFPRRGIRHMTRSADLEKKGKQMRGQQRVCLVFVTHGLRYGTPFVSSSKKRGQ